MELFRKRRWKVAGSNERIPFFTCARPGRSLSSTGPVPDAIVHKWVKGQPGPNTTIVSLLGKKPTNEMSEFSFYSFHGQLDTNTRRKPSWQAWLDKHHKDRNIHVVEHPTIDFQPIPAAKLARIAEDITRLLAERTIVLVDSGGQTRTGTVCAHLSLTEDTRS